MEMRKSTRLVILETLLVGLGVVGCGTQPPPPKTLVSSESGLTEAFQQNWSGWPDGQCIVAARQFYKQSPSPAGAAADLGYQPTSCISAGSWWCASEGTCHAWLVPTVDGNWNRHSMSDGVLPYDVVVYQDPTGASGSSTLNCPAGVTGHYGHIAAVDHVSNGNIFVMDSNWNFTGARAASAHTVSFTPFGFFRLKSREPAPPVCVPSCAGVATCAAADGCGHICPCPYDNTDQYATGCMNAGANTGCTAYRSYDGYVQARRSNNCPTVWARYTCNYAPCNGCVETVRYDPYLVGNHACYALGNGGVSYPPQITLNASGGTAYSYASPWAPNTIGCNY
jgi:hypothetical protein